MALIIGAEGRRYWCAHNGRELKVALEHPRYATREEGLGDGLPNMVRSTAGQNKRGLTING